MYVNAIRPSPIQKEKYVLMEEREKRARSNLRWKALCRGLKEMVITNVVCSGKGLNRGFPLCGIKTERKYFQER